MDELRYEIDLFWSDEDQAYIAEVPELPGCMADGPTHPAAASQDGGEILNQYVALGGNARA